MLLRVHPLLQLMCCPLQTTATTATKMLLDQTPTLYQIAHLNLFQSPHRLQPLLLPRSLPTALPPPLLPAPPPPPLLPPPHSRPQNQEPPSTRPHRRPLPLQHLGKGTLREAGAAVVAARLQPQMGPSPGNRFPMPEPRILYRQGRNTTSICS